ncbi:MAG: hypothetical protein NZ824_11600 [Candidatus Thioglobus sp.]|nr:hypothetical protein [Candidatus Thioglobus sp.]
MSELTGISTNFVEGDPILGKIGDLSLRALNWRYTDTEVEWSKGYYYTKKRGVGQSYNRTSLIDVLGTLMKAPLVDRTRTIDPYYAIISELPEIPDYKVDYHKVCDDKAIEILDECRRDNKDLRVSWSGGIDSTNALSAILKHWDSYPEVDLVVCLNQKSIDEYPWFYEKYLGAFNKIKILMGDVQELAHLGENEALGLNMAKDVGNGKDYVIVTGELGDQVFGAKILINDIKENGTDGLVNKPYEEVFSPDINTFIKPLVDAMPKDWPRDCGNVMHWLNFTLKWQWCQLRMFMMYPIEYKKYRHFYDSDGFQQWTMQNDMSVKMPNYDLKRYKEVAKRYIADYTGDEVYFVNKEKEDSQRCTINVFGSDPTMEGNDPDKVRRHWESCDIDFNKKWKAVRTTDSVIRETKEDPVLGTKKGYEVEMNINLDI